jgi:hypothetical protein
MPKLASTPEKEIMMSPTKMSESSSSSPRRKPSARSKSVAHPTHRVALARVKDDRLDYRLENDLEFLRKIAEARAALKEVRGTRMEDLPA